MVGTVTNLISAIVYSKKKMRKTSYSFYLFSLALADLSITIIGNSRLAVMHYKSAGFDLRETSAAACRLHKFLTYFFLHLSSVILCFLNIDRFFGCVLASKASMFCKPITARLIVLGTIVVLLVLNAHFLVFMGNDFDVSFNSTTTTTTYNATESRCVPDSNNLSYIQFLKFYFYIDEMVYSIFPFVIMITCNFMIITKIVKSRIRSKKVIVSKSKNNSGKILQNTSNAMLVTEKRLSLTLLAISLSFLLFTSPVFVVEHLEAYYDELRTSGEWQVVAAMSYMLMYLNHVINFFFYCLLGPKFRNQVRRLIPFWHMEKNSVLPMSVCRRPTVYMPSSDAKRDLVDKSHNPDRRLSSLKESNENLQSVEMRQLPH